MITSILTVIAICVVLAWWMLPGFALVYLLLISWPVSLFQALGQAVQRGGWLDVLRVLPWIALWALIAFSIIHGIWEQFLRS
jgi:hypothetical protein